MPDSNFWDKVKTESEQPPKRTYTQADLVRSLAEMRAVLQLAGERIKQQSIGRQDDELLRKMRQVYREAREIGRQFEQQSAKNPFVTDGLGPGHTRNMSNPRDSRPMGPKE